ncbi:MAG: hypothetical protein JW703_02520 [Candidatus Diapherotrites archaeon]|nr:hypothetical protein [Candidatus Diapherotrites archaeon]
MNNISELEKEFGAKWIAMFLVKNSLHTSIDLLKESMEKGFTGIYITINKPFEDLKEMFERQKIDLTQVLFIDAITKSNNPSIPETNNCLFVDSPSNLTRLGIILSQSAQAIKNKKISGKKIIILDSLNTFLVYNNEKSVTKFTHFLTVKMKEWGFNGVLLSDEENQKTTNQITMFCDKVIEVKG